MESGEEKSRKSIPLALIGLGVFTLALCLRLLGIGWGLKNDLHNASYHPDEPIVFAFSRAIQPERGQLVPEVTPNNFYSYGTLYLTLLRIASDMTSTYTGGPKVKGDGFSFTQPELTDWDWVSRCHLAGRLITVAAGSGTVLVVFLLLWRVMGRVAGFASASLLAVAPGHVVQSRFQTVDVLATFFLSLSVYYSVVISSRGTVNESPKPNPSILKLAILAGLFAGLSAGAKYTGILALCAVVTALITDQKRKAVVPILAAVGVASLVFVLTTPGVFLDFAHFYADFQYELVHTATGHGLVFTGTPNGFVYTFTNLLFGIGPLLVLLGLAGLGYASFKKHSWAYILLAFMIPYYLLIGRAEVKFLRYSFPLYIGIAAGFGYAVQVCHRRGGVARIGVGLGILGLGGVPFGGIATTTLMTRAMMEEDPRDQAARYIKTQQGHVGFANTPWFWSAPLFPDSADPLSVSMSTKLALSSASSGPQVVAELDDTGRSEQSWSQDLIVKLSPEIITYSSFESFPIQRLQGRRDLGIQQGEVDNATSFLNKLSEKYLQDKFFGNPILGGDFPDMLPEDLLYTNPVVYVWKKKTLNSLTGLVDDFLDHLRIERSASSHTVSAYANDLSTAAELLKGYGLTRWEELDNTMLLKYESTLANGIAKTTAQRRLSALRSFLKYLKRNRVPVLADLPSTGGFKKARTLPKALDQERTNNLFNIQRTETATGLRDRALFELIYGAGLRITEAVDAEISALDLKNSTIRVYGKRGKTRVNPLPDGTMDWVSRYISEARPALVKTPSKYLFISDRGKRLLRQTAYNILKRYAARTESEQSVSPHTLRHTFAVEMLKGGADLRVVQELLGHESIATTQIYTQLDLEEVRKRYEKSHPRR